MKQHKTKETAASGSALWAVMKAHAWDSITAQGYPLMSPPEGPQRFIPVFETREQAIAWADSDEHVAMLMPKVSDDRQLPGHQEPESTKDLNG